MKRRRNPKLQGERAESVFLAEAMQRGFAVSKPFGDSCWYDFIVDSLPHGGGRLSRIQVKSTDAIQRVRGAYQVNIRPHDHKKKYTARMVDFIAAWVRPCNMWYIVPVSVLRSNVIYVCPHRKRLRDLIRVERYREAWHLLREKKTSGAKARSVSRIVRHG